MATPQFSPATYSELKKMYRLDIQDFKIVYLLVSFSVEEKRRAPCETGITFFYRQTDPAKECATAVGHQKHTKHCYSN